MPPRADSRPGRLRFAGLGYALAVLLTGTNLATPCTPATSARSAALLAVIVTHEQSAPAPVHVELLRIDERLTSIEKLLRDIE